MDTIIEFVERNLLSKRPIWRFPSEGLELTLEELYRLSNQYAEKLKAVGVERQDKVGLVFDNSADYVALLIAILKINATAVPLRPKGNKYTKSDNYLITCDEVCGFRLMLYADTSVSPDVFDSWRDKSDKCALSLAAFKLTSGQAGDCKEVPAESSDVAMLQFSSGSTGHPKAVVVTHGMMMAQLSNILANHSRSRCGHPVASSASWMPINHDMGLFIGVLTPLYVGCDNLLAPPVYYMRNPGRWFSHLSRHHVDFTFTTNSALATTLKAIHRKHQDSDIDLSNLHIYIAAEKVSPVILRRCYETLSQLKMPQENVHIGYGMAENALGCACTKTSRINVNHFVIDEDMRVVPAAPDDSSANTMELVSVGTPDSLHEITIRDEGDRILEELSLGEINITGPCVSPGYYHDPEATRNAFIDGRFRSGDLGFFYEGELYFYARRDDMIIVGGRNLVPDDIEGLAEELPFVRPTSTCLLSVENKKNGTEELVLLVEISSSIQSDTLRGYGMMAQSRIYSMLEVLVNRILFCAKGTIEKTSSGKKRRKIIRTRLLNNQVEFVGTHHDC